MVTFSKSLVAASSKPLILGILQEGPSYGYKIIQRIKEISNGEMEWADGMLYPVLHRLEKEKLVTSKWEQSDEGRHRKYYSITELGKSALHKEKENWLSMNEMLVALWSANPSTSNS
ncbi:MAG: PadR family transcriptional regulator [Cyclobacteriaceae bacterium]